MAIFDDLTGNRDERPLERFDMLHDVMRGGKKPAPNIFEPQPTVTPQSFERFAVPEMPAPGVSMRDILNRRAEERDANRVRITTPTATVPAQPTAQSTAPNTTTPRTRVENPFMQTPGMPGWMGATAGIAQALPGGGAASVVPGALPAIQDGETVNLPGGGSYTAPREFVEGQEQARALGFETQEEMQRASRQAGILQGAGDRMTRRAAQKVIGSLQDQGMSSDEIRSAIGYTPQMSDTEAYRKLTELNNKRADGGQDRTMSRIQDKAEISTRTINGEEVARPNQYARVIQLETEINEPVASPTMEDPSATTSISEYMTPSQKKEYERYKEKLARGIKSQKDENRIMGFASNARAKMIQDNKNKQEAFKVASAIAGIQDKEARRDATKRAEKLKAINTKLAPTEEKWSELEGKRMSDGWPMDKDGFAVSGGAGRESEKREWNRLRRERQPFMTQKDEILNSILGVTSEQQIQSNVEGVDAETVITRFMETNNLTREQAIEEARKAGRIQ